jgi:CRP-like cAMP-binding protein
MERTTTNLPGKLSLTTIQQPNLPPIPAFTPVLAGAVEFIANLPAARMAPPGSLLVEQGARSHSIYLIQKGLVKLTHVSECGRETTIGLRSEGWYAGATSALLNESSVYAVRAVTSCMIARLAVHDFRRYLRESPAMMDHFLAGLCFEVAAQASLQVEVMANSAEDRLDHFMLERIAEHPSRRTVDPLPALKQMEVAQLLSISPEHLSRLMHKKKHASTRSAGGIRRIAHHRSLNISHNEV